MCEVPLEGRGEVRDGSLSDLNNGLLDIMSSEVGLLGLSKELLVGRVAAGDGRCLTEKARGLSGDWDSSLGGSFTVRRGGGGEGGEGDRCSEGLSKGLAGALGCTAAGEGEGREVFWGDLCWAAEVETVTFSN